jgi:hypothetical protein
VTRAEVDLAQRVVREVRASLPPDELERVQAVRVTAKPRPDATDLERGCFPTQKAAYYGVQCEQGTPGTTELPDPSPASGEITLFLDNLAPVTQERLRIAVLHEFGHALGHDEETLWALGLYLEDGPPCTPF